MPVMELEYLRKKLEMRAGFLNPRSPFVYLNEDEDGSFWNFEQNFIQLGIKSILKHAPEDIEKLSTLLLAHEVSHTLNTDAEVPKKIDFPFSILNILEDARIEALISGKGYDFHDLHDFSHEVFYLRSKDYESMIRNPYNIGVLLRWRRWGVETNVATPDAIDTYAEFKEFLSDWEKAIDDSIKASSTEEVARIGKVLYEKWKKVFGEKAPENTRTGIEREEKDFGSGEPPEEKNKEEGYGRSPLGRKPEEVMENPELFVKTPVFDWNEEWIRKTAAELRRYLRLPAYTETEYRMNGRRINPVRAENLLPPFKRRETISYSFKNHRLLIVIDGSGSMNGEPFYWASHTVKVLREFFRTDVVITTTESFDPIRIKDPDALRYYYPDGAENYRSLKDMPLKYDFILFLTDAHVCRVDWEYAEKLSRLCKVGAGYVHPVRDSAIEDALRKVFSRYFYSKPDRVAVEVGLYLRRLFLRRG